MDLKGLTDTQLLKARDEIKLEIARRRISTSSVSEQSAMKSLARYENSGTLRDGLVELFSQHLLAMPVSPRETFDEKRVYLQCILAQDWSHVFDNYEDESTNFYVYAHVDPRHTGFACREINMLPCQGIPFYIGKGTAGRAYDLKRNQGHGKFIKFLLDAGHADKSLVKILFDGISERKAMEIESKLIYFFGTIYEKGRKGILYNLDLSKRPNFIGRMNRTVSKQTLRAIGSEMKAEDRSIS